MIRQRLMEHGITQGDIHRATGASRSLVSLVLSGNRRLGPGATKVMDYIAQALNTDRATLFPESDRKRGWRKREQTPKVA